MEGSVSPCPPSIPWPCSSLPSPLLCSRVLIIVTISSCRVELYVTEMVNTEVIAEPLSEVLDTLGSISVAEDVRTGTSIMRKSLVVNGSARGISVVSDPSTT